MNFIEKLIAGSAVMLAGSVLFSSCAKDNPFDGSAEGTLELSTAVKGELQVDTRAIGNDEMKSLRDNCVIYIENAKGVIRKYKGVENVPSQIKLTVGEYVVEGWTGDSVSASYDKKFYRGYRKFQLSEGTTPLTLNCNIANVVTSVDPVSLNVDLKNLKVTFSHSRGSLDFDNSNIPTSKGYFMMPNADKDLSYEIEGILSDGSPYHKEGKIEGVKRAHEYVVRLSADQPPVTQGGALIRIEIEDIPIIQEDIEIFPAPALIGSEFDIRDQVVSTPGNFTDINVVMRGYFGFDKGSVIMDFSSNFTGIESGLNITQGDVQDQLRALGIVVEEEETYDDAPSLDEGKVKVERFHITFTKAFLDALPESDEEYCVTVTGTDDRHNVGSGTLHIANTEAAIVRKSPVGVDESDLKKNLLSVGATTATLTGYIYDNSAANYGIKYREAGTETWQRVYPAGNTRATGYYRVSLSGLKQNTKYEYAPFCDGYDEAQPVSFTTEAMFTIPNASMEEWSTYSASTMLGTRTVTLPGAGGNKSQSFWGSGNEGAATASKTLTTRSTDMFNSGESSARLASAEAVGILAAGNLFVGEYVKTDGTDGVLSIGRSYNGSHPKKLSVWVNYRPGAGVKVKDGNDEFVPAGFKGGNDHGQIYVALLSGAMEIRTKASNRQVFDPNGQNVLAYGQVTWTEAFGPDGGLAKVEIPIEYKEAAKTRKPTHLAIVVTASKYGDYFSGSSQSVMYVDDFELVYE